MRNLQEVKSIQNNAMSDDIDDFLPPWAEKPKLLETWREENKPVEKRKPKPPTQPVMNPIQPPTPPKPPVNRPAPPPIPSNTKPDQFPITQGKLALQLRLNQLPQVSDLANNWKGFIIEADSLQFEIVVRPKIWNKFLAAQNDYPRWSAAISGDLGPRKGNRFTLLNPGVQIFEIKPKPEPVDTEKVTPQPTPNPG